MPPSGFQTRPLSDSAPRSASAAKRRNLSPAPVKAANRGLGAIIRRMWQRRPKTRSALWRFLVKWSFIGAGLVVLYVAFLWIMLPDISDPKNLIASQSTVITDRNGVELYRLFSEEDRTFVAGESIPDHMKKAAIAIEDERFYERGCLDIRAIARAVVLLGRAGGGSTITRQLARNALDLRNENRYQRKIKELILGCQLEGQYTKEELLDLYLNWIPFGRNAYGIEQASRVYFDTSSSELSLAQSVILASLPQRPTYFSPYGQHVHTIVSDVVHEQVIAGEITKPSQIPDEETTIGLLGAYAGTGTTTVYVGGRTDQVLMNMQDQGFITEAGRLAALQELETIEFQPSRENIRAPHFVLWIRDQVLEILGAGTNENVLEQGGLRVETTLDWDLQEAAEYAVQFHFEDLNLRYGAENMALVSVDPQTNEILAYVGNMDYEDEEHGGKIDMAQAPRQPGSSFKPFIYATAFQKGYGPATPIYDVQTKIGDDEPVNFDGLYKGLMTMRTALGASRNVPAAKAFFLAGGENQILALISALGVPSPLQIKQELTAERGKEFDYGWPLALGAAETPLIEMVNGYSSFARGGIAKPLVSIRKITDKKGNLLYEAPDERGEEVLDRRIAYQITSILSDESARPEEYWRSQLTVPGYQTAAKTGTSNKCLEWEDGKDEQGNPIRYCKLRKPNNAWLMGYTPNLVTGVWVGNADSSSLYDKAGGLNTASPIWRDYMMRAHRLLEQKETTFTVPEGIVQPQISTLSGQLPTACTPVAFRKADVFLEEFAPNKPDPNCQQLVVDKVTHLLASDSCPADARESGSFLVAHSLLPERWPFWEEGVRDWVDEQMALWYSAPDHSGAIIPLPVAPEELCDPSLTPGRLVQPKLTIMLPKPNGGASYPSFKPQIEYDVGSTVREVTYKIDGKKVTTATSAPFEPTLRVPRSVQEAGIHTIEVTLVDEYYNTVTKVHNFRFQEDEGAPRVRLIEPDGNLTLSAGDILSIKAEASDNEGGVKYVQFYLGELLLSTKPKEPYAMEYEINVEPGVYDLRAKATDLGGNTSEDAVELIIKN